eukprot:201673-Prorocentrum_lima.AAC.1
MQHLIPTDHYPLLGTTQIKLKAKHQPAPKPKSEYIPCDEEQRRLFNMRLQPSPSQITASTASSWVYPA